MGRRLLLVCGIVGLLAAPGSASAAGFCENKTVETYSAPLEAMPPLPPVPFDNDLPFGPGHLLIAEVFHPEIVTRATTLGFSLEYGRAAGGPARLDWLVVGRLVRVSPGERKKSVVERRVRKVGRMQPGNTLHFRFPVSAEPSLYRLELDFHGPTGRRLGRLGEYFRVMLPRSDLRLSLNGGAFRPGDTVAPCIENHGTEELVYGACDPAYEHLEGGQWTHYPPGPVHPCIAIAYSLPAGHEAPGDRLEIPSNAPPGAYRAAMDGATAEFQVLPPG
jgi:hypothetical protein